MTDRFRTQRLTAEQLHERHLADLVAMHKMPEVMVTLGGTRTEASTRDYLAANLEHWRRYGFGLWVLRDEEGNFAGRGGIRHLEVEERDEVEIAYSFLQPYWGKGLATELAQELIKLAFGHYRLPDLVGLALVNNTASRRVMEKQRFRFEREVDHGGCRNALYRLRA